MKTRCAGQSIIEILLAMGLSLLFLPALFIMFFTSREGRAQQIERTRATAIATEAQEVLRSIRESGWDGFAAYTNGSAYHPVQTGNTWSLAAGDETVEGFTRSIVFSIVRRSAAGAIVDAGGFVDPSTRKATVTVSWTSPIPSQVTLVSYLTRHSNIVVTDTTDTDFSAGTLTDLSVITLDDGEVVLSSTGGYGDWCTPQLTISALDLPKNGVANAVSAIQGRVAAGTGDNASGVSFANVLISDPAFPTNPQASISGTFDGFKTNGVFTESAYAYLATDTNTKEVVIIDLSTTDGSGKFSEAGFFNAPGNGNASSVTTSGSVGYMTGGTKLYSFDLSQKSGSRPILDSDGVTLPAAAAGVTVRGGRAFIVTGSTSAQLVIVNVSDPSNLSVTSQIALSGLSGTGLYVNSSGSRAYVTTRESSSQREVFIVDTEAGSPTYGLVMGSYDTAGMDPKGAVVVSGPRPIVVGTGGQEYQVADITNESTNPLPKCGGIDIDTGVNGIDTVFTSAGRAYSYIITGDSTTELKIIEGGPGATGHDYVLNGTFESRIFDMESIASGSARAVFNRISASITKPSAVTNITMQVAAADPVAGSCTGASYTYVGPDGTAGSSYSTTDGQTIAGTIPFSDDGFGFENPARCFRYRGLFSTTDHTMTPILEDVTVAFSP